MKLHNYQKTAFKHCVDNTHSAIFLDMGLGKTLISLSLIDFLIYENLEINKVLVIAPKRVADHVWQAEIEKWPQLRHLRISKIIGTEKQRLAALRTPADVYTLGRDNVPWLTSQYGGSKIPFDMLIIDESSSFKNPKALRFKALRYVQPYFKRIVLLTGTPAPNTLIDIWAQIYLLDRGERLNKSITKFRELYFNPNQRNGAIIYNYKLKEQAERAIYDKINDICISMSAKDYLSLPERINNYIDIKFSEKLQKQYDDFEKEQVLELLNADITAINAAALSTKLLQFANGAIYDGDRNIHEVHDLKLKACEELIEAANGRPVLIAWTYRHDLTRLKEHLKKYKPVELKGNETINDWNAGKIQVLLTHPASGGHGLNLQAGGSIIIWFGQTWSLELYQQLNARLDRQGQNKKVIINHLKTINTIDVEVLKALDRKDAGQNALLQAVKAKIEKYGKAKA